MNLSGKVVGRLTVIKESGRSVDGRLILWLCQCECGNNTNVASADINRGHIKSCGCLKKDKLIKQSTTHGMSKTRIYRIWKGIKARCHNTKDSAWPDYGGRGITVCDRWRDSFESFAKDMGEPAGRATIERIDNSKGYSPENCRWATYKEQARNTRRNRVLTHNGETMCMSAWAEKLNVSPHLIKDRLSLGWSVDKALNVGQ